MQYQPALRPDQVTALYHLKCALKRPMTKLAREAVDSFLAVMKRKETEALRAGTTLSEWLEYEKDMEEASDAAKQSADLQDITPLSRGTNCGEGSPWLSSPSRRRPCRTEI